MKSDINYKKINEEIYAQLDKFKTEYKFEPEHIDGHNHCNIFNRDVEAIFEKIAENKRIILRIPYEIYNNYELKQIFEIEDYKEAIRLQNMSKTNENYIIDNFEKFCKYDILINNINCIKNCSKKINNIKFIGTIYGYSRKPENFINKINKIQDDETITTMFHPGFYLHFITHKTAFSNKDRVQELKSLKLIKKYSKNNKIKFVKYGEIINE